MPRRRFVWNKDTCKMDEVPLDYEAPAPEGPFVMGDIQPFVTTDKVEITSRSGLREYERRNNVRQVGNDYNPTDF